jgi:hypothetical protein
VPKAKSKAQQQAAGAALAAKRGQEVIDTLERELRAFSATESLNDDFTCLILEFMELASAPAAPAPSDESHGGEFEEF